MGISNLLFNTERDETANCSPVAPPNGYYNLANQTIHPYSDFALHHMGPRLADQIG
jgi:hypothetical protein